MRILIKRLLIFLFCVSSLLSFAEEVCYFIPPNDWKRATFPVESNHIKVGFIGSQGPDGFCPSLNLAMETMDLPLSGYLRVVKKLHLNMGSQWRDLGEFNFKAGKGRLTEIQTNIPNSGPVILLQGIYVKNGRAYILTGASSKGSFLENKDAILKSMQSLAVTEDLFQGLTALQQEQIQMLFTKFDSCEEVVAKQRAWGCLQKWVREEGSSLGGHWQWLVLQKGFALLFPNEPFGM